MTRGVTADARLVGFAVVFFALAETLVIGGIWPAEPIEFKSDTSPKEVRPTVRSLLQRRSFDAPW